MNISLDKIRIDCGTQAREKIDQQTVNTYCQDIKDGAIFPPVTAYYDGVNYYLADGFHRFFSTKAAGSPGIDCDVINGTLREAILFSVGANPDHGLPRTNADKRKSVMTMLDDLEWEGWSDREIAKYCKVSHVLVGMIRKEMGKQNDTVKFERNGKTHTMEKPAKADKENVVKSSHLVTLPDSFEDDDQKENLFAAVDMLKAENEALTDKLALASMSPEDADKEMAESLIKDLRAQIRLLEIELKAVQISRDSFQRENVELMKQVQSYQRKIKKDAK